MPVLEAVVGIAFGELLTAVTKTIDKAVMFKQSLDSLRCTLEAISSVMEDIERLKKLERSKKELESLIKTLKEGRDLVDKCSKIHWLNCVLRARDQVKLEALENSLMRFFTIFMLAESARILMENGKLNILNRDGRDMLVPEPGKLPDRVFAYMLTARNLYIAWGSTSRYWSWTSLPDSRFEVAELVEVCWLEIKGWIKTSMLPQNAMYEAYFVFKLRNNAVGFKNRTVEVSVKVAGEGDVQRRKVCLEAATRSTRREPSAPAVEHPSERADGWMEVKLGEFFNGDRDNKEVEMDVYETKDLYWKRGILVQGIEIRSK